MDIKSYIASGVLELYVLGKLSPEEAAEVERYAREYAEIRQELDATEEALQQFAMLHAQAPPPGALSGALQRIQEADSAASASRPEKPIHRLRFLAYAASALLVLAIAALLVLLNKKQSQQFTITALQEELDALGASCDSLQANYAQAKQEMDFLGMPGTRQVVLRGTELAPDALATIYYNPDLRKNLLAVVQMPAPPVDKQYQLWAIVDGKPVNMGVFDVDASAFSLQEAPFFENPQAFAVTLEVKGGSPTPTLDQMYVIGNT